MDVIVVNVLTNKLERFIAVNNIKSLMKFQLKLL